MLLGLAASAAARADLRCGGRLITEGDRPYDVLAICGRPDYREEIPGTYLPGIGVLTDEERWYYNRGPRELLRVVRIRDGRVAAIDTPGYGFDASLRGDCAPNVLRIGMSGFELVTRCGEPAYKERRLRTLPADPPAQPYPQVIPIEEWTYDFGGGDFTRILTLTEGTVRDIDTGRRH